MKRFYYNNRYFKITKQSHGFYKIESVFNKHDIYVLTNDSNVFDYVDDDEHPSKKRQALKDAYNIIRNRYYELYLK